MSVFLGVFAVLLASDLALKHWAFHDFPGQPVEIEETLEHRRPLPDDMRLVVPNLLALKLTLNTGAVFGLGAGYRWVFITATILAIGVIGYFFCVSWSREWWVHIALAMILAGAVGNMYDRIQYGAVRDMLWLFPGLHLPFGWTWPGGTPHVYPWIFNAADAYLLIGIGMILLRSLFISDQPEGAPEPSS